MKDSFRVAFCGLICALALVLMISTGIVPVATYAFPCFAGILLVAVVIELGEKWAIAAYVSVSILSLFLAGDKESVAYFIAFFGFYPIAKSGIEKLKSRILQYVIKYALFTVCMIAAFSVCKFVLAIPDEEFTLLGFYIPWAFLAVAELVFVVYDKCITILVVRYITTIRNRIFKNPPSN
ncbi:MAG: hypothetical protein J1E41_07225 [Ruminococcus sp.]|nr:hypothetical protein [Ruminococcus sp.]